MHENKTADRSPAQRGGPGTFNAGALAAVAGTMLGMVTAFGQGWLPVQLASLANSSGSWALLAFGIGMIASSPRVAALSGFIALASLLAGYVAINAFRGFSSSSGLLIFWGVAALTVGPLLGVGGHWFRHRRDRLAACGIGGMSGVLIGEGAYGLLHVAETTYPPYWWGSIAAGVVMLAIAIVVRLRRLSVRVTAVLVTALVSAAFVLIYSNADAIFQLL